MPSSGRQSLGPHNVHTGQPRVAPSEQGRDESTESMRTPGPVPGTDMWSPNARVATVGSVLGRWARRKQKKVDTEWLAATQPSRLHSLDARCSMLDPPPAQNTVVSLFFVLGSLFSSAVSAASPPAHPLQIANCELRIRHHPGDHSQLRNCQFGIRNSEFGIMPAGQRPAPQLLSARSSLFYNVTHITIS